MSAGGPLTNADLALLSERVSAHIVAVVALEDQIEILRTARVASGLTVPRTLRRP
jgi:hypothetical protein